MTTPTTEQDVLALAERARTASLGLALATRAPARASKAPGRQRARAPRRAPKSCKRRPATASWRRCP